MNTRALYKAFAALGAVVVTAAALLMATEAAATSNRNAAAAGRSATQLPRLLPADAGMVLAFAFDPADSNTVYVGTDHQYSNCRLYKSTDSGEHWQLISGPRGWKWLGALASDPKHPGTLYASTSTGIHKTTDGGRTWHEFTQGLVPPSGEAVGEGFGRLAVDPNNSNIVYSGLGLGIHKSIDAGHTWKTVQTWQTVPGHRARSSNLVLVAATRPSTILADAFGPWRYTNGKKNAPTTTLLLRSSTDGGTTWRRTRFDVTSKHVNIDHAVVADPGSPTTLYAAVDTRIFTSTDAGQSWHVLGQHLPQNADVTSLAAGAGTVYAALGKNGIYETSDGGKTWTQSWPQAGTARGLGVSIVAIDPARPTTIYASAYYPNPNRDTGTHILRSTDSGRTWTVVG
jgi:photosystem II stability/assembly factor-like uncharacterized protein